MLLGAYDALMEIARSRAGASPHRSRRAAMTLGFPDSIAARTTCCATFGQSESIMPNHTVVDVQLLYNHSAIT